MEHNGKILTIEQQFSISSFAQQVEKMGERQAKDFLIKFHKQMIIREATYQELLKHNWGVSNIEELG